MTCTINAKEEAPILGRKLMGRSPEFYGVAALLCPLLQIGAFFLFLWAAQIDLVIIPFFGLPVLTLISGGLAVYAGRVFKKRIAVGMGLAGIAIEILLFSGMLVLLGRCMTDI